MYIHWLSNAPWVQTGYGCQTRLVTPRIHADGHEVKISAFYGLEGGVLNWNGSIPVMSRARHLYGQDIVGAQAFGSDILISLVDAWVCEPQNYPHLRWVPWFPIDHEPLPPVVRERVKQAYHRIVMSKFGARMMEAEGLDYSYVPHGIETNVFKPIDRAEARKTTGLPKDAFIVGMVAANKGTPSRKAFTFQIEAFAQLKKKHPDAIMYIHTFKAERGENNGVNLPEFVRYVGLRVGEDVIFPDQYQTLTGFPDEHMNALYNSFDVHTLVSAGEGFGIPIVEAQAAGCPVIVGDWTSMGELVGSGWKVDRKDAQAHWTPVAAWQWFANVGAIADLYELAYHKKDNEVYRKRARQFAIEYDADAVYRNYWQPTIKKIQQQLATEEKLPDMKLVKF